MAKKRERLEVIRDILEATRSNRKIKPTRLLYASNLSPQMFKEYIGELLAKGFIKDIIEESKKKSKKDQKYFVITIKGNNFLQEYKVIEGFVENFGL
jgi:predicted transcriptional regulator